MKRARALFVTRRVLELGGLGHPSSTSTAGWLRDYAARGYRLFVVADALSFEGRGFGSKTEMLAWLRSCERHALPVADVLLLDNAFDPAPFWDTARRFNVALHTSVFVSAGGELSGAVRNAGIAQSETGQTIGLAA